MVLFVGGGGERGKVRHIYADRKATLITVNLCQWAYQCTTHLTLKEVGNSSRCHFCQIWTGNWRYLVWYSLICAVRIVQLVDEVLIMWWMTSFAPNTNQCLYGLPSFYWLFSLGNHLVSCMTDLHSHQKNVMVSSSEGTMNTKRSLESGSPC